MLLGRSSADVYRIALNQRSVRAVYEVLPVLLLLVVGYCG